MLYGSRLKWWGDGGERRSSHEGLDFHSFDDGSGARRTLAVSSRVAPLLPGGEATRYCRYSSRTRYRRCCPAVRRRCHAPPRPPTSRYHARASRWTVASRRNRATWPFQPWPGGHVVPMSCPARPASPYLPLPPLTSPFLPLPPLP